MLLTLPALDPAIPPVVTFDNHNRDNLRVALAMSESGLIADGAIATLTPRRVSHRKVLQLIEQGWNDALAGCYEFHVVAAHATLTLPRAGDEHHHANPDFGIFLNGGDADWIAVGPIMSHLEGVRRGLGVKALTVMDRALAMFGLPYTPAGAMEMARYQYWHGEDDEQAALEEADDDYADDVPKKSELFDGIPAWAYEPDYDKLMKPRTFQRLARQFKEDSAGALLAALAALEPLLSDAHQRMIDPPEEFDCPEPPVMLYWGAKDNLGMVFDAHYRCVAEGYCAPALRFEEFPVTPEAISKALPRIRHTGLVLTALDKALVAIKDWEARTNVI
jgi:PRTRC genetic system protein F